MPVKYRASLILASTLAAMLAGSAISFAGLIGFVGLVSPHMARLLCREDFHLQIPIAAVFGATLCLICDLIARTAFAPTEVSISSVTAVFGAPIVIYMMIHRKAG